jgi:hypothetical protein
MLPAHVEPTDCGVDWSAIDDWRDGGVGESGVDDKQALGRLADGVHGSFRGQI